MPRYLKAILEKRLIEKLKEHYEDVEKISKPVKFFGATCIILFLLIDH